MSAKPSPAPVKPEKLHPLHAARRAGVPLLAIETSDPAQTIAGCIRALNDKAATTPIMRWDVLRGLVGLNNPGEVLARELSEDPLDACNPSTCLAMLAKIRKERRDRVVCFFMNAHRYIQNEAVAQGLWNLRDIWKEKGSTLVLLCPMLELPGELSHDIVVVTEQLPGPEEVSAIVDSIAQDAKLKEVPDKEKVVDTLLGVSAFAAEQVLAMSIAGSAPNAVIDRDELWTLKRKMVEQTPGLTVWKEASTFADLGGLDNIKAFLTKILTSPNNPVRCIGFIDEIEKLFAGSQGDLSGVSQDQLRVFLTEMQDHTIPGMILVGPPGTGKSAIAKAAGGVAEAEVLNIDTGAMTGSLVGESQAKIRKAFQTFHAVSQGKSLLIATCNRLATLPPELRRRFTLGTFFIDLPDADERAAIWKLWLKKYNFDAKSKLPDDDGWTGAEIRACCDVAFRTDMSLEEASTFVVPVCKSAAEQIEALRKQADGRFISASKPGTYRAPNQASAPTPSGRRHIAD